MDDCWAHRGSSGHSTPKLTGVGATRRPAVVYGDPPELARLERLFSSAESTIALLGRLEPRDVGRACDELVSAFQAGKVAPLTLRHAPPPDFSELRRSLERAAAALSEGDDLSRLYAERAAELSLEAALVEAQGTPAFRRLALAYQASPDAADDAAARELSEAWVKAPAASGSAPRIASDDTLHPQSLIRVLGRQMGELRLPLRVRAVRHLASRAALGNGEILLLAGELLTPREAARIAAHELLGHALPRARARAEPLALCRVGSACSGAEEEGRALLIEERAGFLDAPRRRELGLRHLAALDVRHGHSAMDVVRNSVDRGCTLAEAARLYARVARGGGLCRELTYVPRWLRLKRVLAADAQLECWLERGRLSIEAARRLRTYFAKA